MCGLAGFFQLSGDADRAIIRRMTDAIRHRGPDDAGFWFDERTGLALGHRRLSILDLSQAGHQPMLSACGRFVLAFNGEIYNHTDLRARLNATGHTPSWRGHSDTETLLACFVAWGVEATLQATVGMFAIALWDRDAGLLTLARDRMGEKPLYYGWQGDVFLFGSELKALQQHPAFLRQIDRGALALLLRHNHVPAPYSIFRGIHKLMPGHYLQVSLPDADRARLAVPHAYWRLNDVVQAGLANPFRGTAAEAVDLLGEQLSASVRSQMLADVPLGAFLSGGIDSSTVVALMQAQSRQPVRTFTIGFDHHGYNEAAHALAVARHLGTDHTELFVQPQSALDVISRLPAIYCEPFADSSQIPTFLVSQLARQHVAVALSGDGGDELFGGYNRYLSAFDAWQAMQRLPAFVRHVAAGILRTLPPSAWDRFFSLVAQVLPPRWQLASPGDKVQKLAGVLTLADGQAFYRQLVSQWQQPSMLVIGADEPPTLLTDTVRWPQTDSFQHWMMAMDAQAYMPDDILVKVDRAAMANSLETRVPLLDHRVVELAWRMPLSLKIADGQGKWLLRQLLYRHVPASLVERPKMGFAIPLGDWLRGPLRNWADALLDAGRLQREGFFHAKLISHIWSMHLSGRQNNQDILWTVLMFQAWLEKQSSSCGGA